MSLVDWFEKGMTFEEYRSKMQTNQQELTHVFENVSFTEDDISIFNHLKDRNLRGIVLTADWCGDAALCVPIFQRIAEFSNIDLHFLIRDENMELMNQYLTNGTSASIPIFIFFDKFGKEVMVWGPRTPEVQELITTLVAALPEKDAVDFKEKQMQMYSSLKEKLTTDHSIWRTVIDSAKVTFTSL